MGCNSVVLVLHRPGRARARGEPAAGRDRRRGDAPRRRGRPGDHAARPERQLVRPRPRPDLETASPSCCAPCDAVDGIERIRFTSPHPKDFRRDVIAAMAECDAVCEHAHLPLQSGSTRVLKAMRRTYSRERYLRLVDELRAAIPDLALTTDIIVGFPGETERDFERDARGRRGGPATTARSRSSTRRGRAPRRPTMPDQVPDEVKRDRIERLVEVVQRIAAASATRSASAASSRCSSRARAGPIPRSCAAARAATRPSTSPGRARAGELVDVRIEGATSTTLRGTELAAVAA